MTTVTLRIPDEKHARLRLLAESRGIKTRAARGSVEEGLALLDEALKAV